MLARRNESTNDKIVRMYKEGRSIESIASELMMPRDNVPKILEKYMPDYANYSPSQSGKDKPEKAKKGLLGALKRDKGPKENTAPEENKEQIEEPAPAPKPSAKVNINLTMDENGFIDGVVRGIASMLQNGKDVSTIADFFNRDEDDIIAVRECMDEHFKRAAVEEEPVSANENQEPVGKVSYSSFTGLEEGGVLKYPKFTAPEKNEPEVMDEMPSIDPVSLDELDKQIEAMDNHHTEEAVEEIPSAEPVQIEELVTNNEPVQQETAPSNDDSDGFEFTVDKEDDTMSPMEKMKKFAEQQIAINNTKIEELKAKREEAVGSNGDIDNEIAEAKKAVEENTAKKEQANNDISQTNDKLAELKNQIEELEAKLSALNDDVVSCDEKAGALNEKVSELEAKKSKADEAAAEIDKEIAEIEKENEEFASFGK